MVKKIIGNNIMFPEGIKPGTVFIKDGIISEDDGSNVDELVDAGDDLVCPAFVDIHTHGAIDIDFTDCSPSEMVKAIKYMISHGAGAILPTITSSTKENILKALECVKQAMQDKEVGGSILGAHLEGPYFSLEQSGAQDKALITEPIKEDYEEIIAKYGDIIKRWDFAPERDKGGAFAKYLTDHSIIAATGHSNAKYNDMVETRKNGCNLITHLYSCTSTITRDHGYRSLGIIECAYLWDDMYIEIIADGKHLPIELLKLILKLKDHHKIILITDSLKAAGSSSIYSNVGTTKCVVDDGVCKLLDKSAFAGSIATADRLLENILLAGASIEDAILMGSTNPSELLNVKFGKIKIGYNGNLLILNKKSEKNSIQRIIYGI